ncbi:MAG: MFS transporter [Clostridia bacterium]|nr:MFS transporter [Clostridia bacterium]
MEALQGHDFASKEYRRSRRAYAAECTFEYFVSLLVTEAFLSKVLLSIGMSDGLIQVVSTLIALSQLFQFFSIFVVQRITNTKRFVVLFHTVGQLLFMALYFVPFLPFAGEYKTVVAIGCILVAYFGNYFVTNIIYNWGNSYVSPSWRGLFGAKKEILSLLTGIVMTVVIGYAMDYFEEAGNLEGGFIFAAIGILIFCICDFVCLMMIKNDIKPREEIKKTEPIGQVMKKLFKIRGFQYVLILTVLWNVGIYTTIGALGTYRITELDFSMSEITYIAMAGCLARALLSRPFGRFADKYTRSKALILAMVMATAAFAINVFTTPDTRYLIIVYTILYNGCFAGMSVNLLNIVYSYVPAEYFVQASAIKNSIGGICGFLASIAAGTLLDYIQSQGNTFLGIHVYAQQVLSLISVILIVAAIVFTKLVMDKQKEMKQ